MSRSIIDLQGMTDFEQYQYLVGIYNELFDKEIEMNEEIRNETNNQRRRMKRMSLVLMRRDMLKIYKQVKLIIPELNRTTTA